MKTQNVYCDYCKKKTTSDDKKIEETHGLVIEAGYSKNGWGDRKDFFKKQQVEVCTECFDETGFKIAELCNEIYKRKSLSK